MYQIDTGDLIEITFNGETKTYKVLDIRPDTDDPVGPYGYQLLIIEVSKDETTHAN